MGRLNQQGINRFERFIEEVKQNPELEIPFEMLSFNSVYTDKVILPSGRKVSVDYNKSFDSRYEVAKYISDQINPKDIGFIIDDRGIGAWLGLAFFNATCPKKDGVFDPGHSYRFIPNLTGRKNYYRHQVVGPLAIFHHIEIELRLKNRSSIYLCQSPQTHPDTVEQIASREEIMLCPAVVEVIHRLYWDPTINDVKTGSQGEKDGAIRRFVGPGGFFRKFYATWDFYSMSADAVWSMLDEEFEAFKELYNTSPKMFDL